MHGLLRLGFVASALFVVSCSSSKPNAGGDLDNAYFRPAVPSVLGDGRIKDVTDPNAQGRPAPGSTVTVEGVVVTAIDTYDETNNGKSRGTIYVQDFGSHEPYSGVGLFSASFVPAGFRVAVGDVVDLTGQYQENAAIGTAVFTPPQVLPQIAKPVMTLRLDHSDATKIQPTLVKVTDLGIYDKGRAWIGALVTVEGVTLGGCKESSGRVTSYLSADTSKSGPQVDNELYAYACADHPDGTKYKSVTGIVTYFFNLKIAPRSAADFVQ